MSKELMAISSTSLDKAKFRNILLQSVGIDNGIMQADLVRKLFPKTDNPYRYFFNCMVLNSAANYLRKNTDFFVVGERTKLGTIYYVLKTEQELKRWKARSSRHIAGIKQMVVKAEKHVREKRWKYL